MPMFAVKHTKCVSCGEEAIETERMESFVYGENNGVVLTVMVPVVSCGYCSIDYTDKRAETIREEAVRKHLEKKGVYLCSVCRVNPVNASEGFDTCEDCS